MKRKREEEEEEIRTCHLSNFVFFKLVKLSNKASEGYKWKLDCQQNDHRAVPEVVLSKRGLIMLRIPAGMAIKVRVH